MVLLSFLTYKITGIIHILFRPADKNEKILREDCLSLGKLAEEGFLSETPTILGWVINTRLLTISLPGKKFKYWDQDLVKVIKTKKVSFKDLEKILGRLNHAAMACPLMRYFLSRMRKVLLLWQNSNYTKKVKNYLSSQVIEDFKLWQRVFLPKIYRGISLNLISYRRPLVISWSDACPRGMGGYDSLRNAWQYKLSEDDRIACTYQNNSLEFVAVLISVWVSIKNNTAESKMCFLALSDNSSAIDDTKNLPLHMASRKYAEILMGADCCSYSQHIAGKQNVVADYLSRNFDHLEEELTSFVLSNYTNQVPT
jgi:hypothetical protein